MPTPNAVLIRNALLWDGAADQPVPGLSLRVEGGRIAALGPNLPDENATVMDAGGRLVMPGLIDCHVHLGAATDPSERYPDSPPSFLSWQMARNAERSLLAGYTTLRDLASEHSANIHLARATELGLVQGPRIIAAGAGICITGGHSWTLGGRQADGADEMRRAVREQLREGAGCIKLIATGGVITPGSQPGAPQMTPEELGAAIEEAHKAGKRVAAHAHGTIGIKNAVRAGVDSIEHGSLLDDEAVKLMREHGTYLVPTLSAHHNYRRMGRGTGTPDFIVEKIERLAEAQDRSIRLAIKAGLKIAAGTDAGNLHTHHGNNAQEITLLNHFGLPRIEALRAATSRAADLLDLVDETGRLRPGLSADLIVVDGDPFQDLSILEGGKSVQAVMLRGAWVRTIGSSGG
ncbi:MAG: amidohydrolase family protein [Dehalococcoidia bacterium]